MLNIWLYSLLSVFIISLISLIGIISLSIKSRKLEDYLLYLVSFSAGALLGDAFIHLFPEIVEEFGLSLEISIAVLIGIILFFIIEKIIHWRHCHILDKKGSHEKEHKPFAIINLIGDAFHNFLDGIIIGAAYLINIPAGIATTIAVALHEIPQEIGDFAVLLHGGFTKTRALFMNFLTALSAILGVILVLIASNLIENLSKYLVPLAIGGFLYIAGADLIPELHKETTPKKSIVQLLFFILGILVMMALLLLE